MKCGTRRIWTGGFVRRGKAILPHFAVSLLGCVLLSMPVRVHGVQEAQTSLRFPDVRIMVIIREVHRLAEPVQVQSAETEVIRIFTEVGYKVVDQSYSAIIRNSPDFEEILREPTGLKARAKAAEHGADILIVGEGLSETAGPPSPGYLARATVHARAVVMRDARILAAPFAEGSASDPGEITAGRRALRDAAEKLGKDLLKKIGEFVNGPTEPNPPPDRDKNVGVAVFAFDLDRKIANRDDKFGLDLADEIGTSLLESNWFKKDGFAIVARESIAAILIERGLDPKIIYDNPGSLAPVGGLLPAKYLIVGRIRLTQEPNILNGYRAKIEVRVKVIKVENGTVLAQPSVNAESKGGPTDTVADIIRRAIPALAQKVVEVFKNAVEKDKGRAGG